ncbi:MAG: hypothetical protein EOO90_03760 [Pedobacter sp.]|nr:MAG: hypothetical protein EOO90_03760 [Pedobacter sp.]
MNNLISDGIKFVYCLKGDKCVTVWKRTNGEFYIIFKRYESGAVPSDNYVQISNLNRDYVDVLFVNENKILIAIDEKAYVVLKSSKGVIELYMDHKVTNDSLYTYADGNYRLYRKEIDVISINLEENYATDKAGKKLN